MRSRLPIVLSLLALVVALLGSGRLDAVAQTVVDFARNADRVDGIHASRTPRANRLLALNARARFPPSAIPPQTAFFSSQNGPLDLATAFGMLDSLDLAAGGYVLLAKAWLRNDGSSATAVQCRLQAGTAFDESDLRLEASGERNARSLALSFMLVHDFAAPGRADLRCRDFGASAKAFQVKVTAIRVGRLLAR